MTGRRPRGRLVARSGSRFLFSPFFVPVVVSSVDVVVLHARLVFGGVVGGRVGGRCFCFLLLYRYYCCTTFGCQECFGKRFFAQNRSELPPFRSRCAWWRRRPEGKEKKKSSVGGLISFKVSKPALSSQRSCVLSEENGRGGGGRRMGWAVRRGRVSIRTEAESCVLRLFFIPVLSGCFSVSACFCWRARGGGAGESRTVGDARFDRN